MDNPSVKVIAYSLSKNLTNAVEFNPRLYIYVFMQIFRRHRNEKRKINNKTTISRKSEKKHEKMNMKSNTNIWIYILSKGKRKRKISRIMMGHKRKKSQYATNLIIIRLSAVQRKK